MTTHTDSQAFEAALRASRAATDELSRWLDRACANDVRPVDLPTPPGPIPIGDGLVHLAALSRARRVDARIDLAYVGEVSNEVLLQLPVITDRNPSSADPRRRLTETSRRHIGILERDLRIELTSQSDGLTCLLLEPTVPIVDRALSIVRELRARQQLVRDLTAQYNAIRIHCNTSPYRVPEDLLDDAAYVTERVILADDEIEQLWSEMPLRTDSPASYRHTIRIGLLWMHARTVVAPALKLLADQNFDVETRTATANPDPGFAEQRSWLRNGLCDIIIGGPPLPDEISEVLYQTHLVALIPQHHPLTRGVIGHTLAIEDLFDPTKWRLPGQREADPQLLVLTRSFFARQTLEAHYRSFAGYEAEALPDSLAPLIAHESSSPTALVAFADADQGVAVFSRDSLPAGVPPPNREGTGFFMARLDAVVDGRTDERAPVVQQVCAHYRRKLPKENYRYRLVRLVMEALHSAADRSDTVETGGTAPTEHLENRPTKAGISPKAPRQD